ncbi:MAG: hypothetical protein JXB39_13620 [Deltaproteobacteria bacterium]|nr:hypothetical protein [Deltaproteobacteria bacterium]
MDRPPRRPISLAVHVVADIVLIGTMVWVGWLFARTVGPRLSYPFDLEWMEGGMLTHALRVSQGLPLYVEPGPEFIPFIYPPLYPWVVGTLGRLGEVSYTLGRAVSVAGTVVACLLLVVGVARERLRWTAGVAAAALFLSCYDEVGAFFDIVRTDGLLVALLGGALLACRRATRPMLATGGVFLALAFATKHSVAVLGIPIAIVLWREYGWRRALWFAAWSMGPALAFTLVMEIASQGRFLEYVLLVPATHPIVGQRVFPLSEKELASAFPLALAAAAVALLFRFRHRSFGFRYWTPVALTGLVLVVLMRGHHGGYLNVLIPGFWLLSLLAGIGLGLGFRAHPLLHLALAGLVAHQVWSGGWTPSRYTPTQADRRAGEQVLDILRSYPGPVLMPHSPWYPVLVGKEPSFALIALWDVTHSRTPFPDTNDRIAQALRERRYDAVILASERFRWGLNQSYERVRAITLPGRALFPKTGWRARPRYVYEPRETPKAAAGPRAAPIEATGL